ncbi:TrmB family transcriptional regulator [Natronococcus roseus]|uniref:TrmB family transcriptional regulator n=1 Tax=Natronococcus roseus TaxID=1052014 RepID=UPI00374CCF42
MTDLRELGLSSYEEDVYRTLLVCGPATATEISSDSNVPRGRIYDILNGLSDRQLVQTRSHEPKRYAAIDPKTAIDRLLSERFYELEQEWYRLENIADRLRSDLFSQAPLDGSIWRGSIGSSSMIRATRDRVQTIDEDLSIVYGLPYKNAQTDVFLDEVTQIFESSSGEISIDFIFNIDVLEALSGVLPDLVATTNADVQIRGINETTLSFEIIDSSKAALEIPHPRIESERFGFVGISNSELVNELNQQFQQLWYNAKPVL